MVGPVPFRKESSVLRFGAQEPATRLPVCAGGSGVVESRNGILARDLRRTSHMHINHIDIPVPDIAATRDFFLEKLGFTHVATLGRDGLAILKDDCGATLVFSRTKGSAPADGFHIGFLQENREAVDRVHARLRDSVECEAPRDMHGGYVFYFEAPGPILIEVGHRP